MTNCQKKDLEKDNILNLCTQCFIEHEEEKNNVNGIDQDDEEIEEHRNGDNQREEQEAEESEVYDDDGRTLVNNDDIYNSSTSIDMLHTSLDSSSNKSYSCGSNICTIIRSIYTQKNPQGSDGSGGVNK